MAIPPFNILDTKLGDRVLGPDQVADLLAQAGADPAFSSPPPIGDVAPNTGAFTALTADTVVTPAASAEVLTLATGTKAATAVAGAATLNKASGVITSEDLTTAADASYALTLTDSVIEAGDVVVASVQLGTATEGTPQVVSVTVTASTAVIVVKNIHATQAFNGNIKIAFAVFK